MEINPIGLKNILLTKYNDHIEFSQPKTCVFNIIFGKMYVDFDGVKKL